MTIATRDDLTPGLEALEVAHVVELSVLEDMRLLIEPVEVARSGEHNSATFRIVQQPASLDAYVCRAEVQTNEGTTYRLVVDGEFSLTADVAVQGINRLQLVYSDGIEIIRKTYQAPFHVSGSVNAVDESDPEFQDGLGQMQRAAFANAVGDSSGIQFYNISDQPLDFVAWPPGSGEGLDEATANLLYVRQDGTTQMSGDLRMIAAAGIDAPIGVYIGGRQASIMWANALQFRRGQAGEPVQIADNNGSNASEVVTRALGASLYLSPDQGDIAYLRKDGGQMTGPFISQYGNSNTNLGVSVGENSSGFWRSGGFLICASGGQTAWQTSTTEMLFGVRINAANQPVINIADPANPPDAANKRYVDSAVAAVPRPAIPAARTYIATEVTISTSDQVFFDQPFFTADNQPRTILITIQPEFDGGTPSQFSDLIYTTSLSVGLQSRITVYGTAAGYMHGTACFAATVTPASLQIPVQLSVRQNQAGTTALIQVGSRTNLRTYVTIQEMTQ